MIEHQISATTCGNAERSPRTKGDAVAAGFRFFDLHNTCNLNQKVSNFRPILRTCCAFVKQFDQYPKNQLFGIIPGVIGLFMLVHIPVRPPKYLLQGFILRAC